MHCALYIFVALHRNHISWPATHYTLTFTISKLNVQMNLWLWLNCSKIVIMDDAGDCVTLLLLQCMWICTRQAWCEWNTNENFTAKTLPWVKKMKRDGKKVLLSQGRFISRHESNKSGRFVFVNCEHRELDGIVDRHELYQVMARNNPKMSPINTNFEPLKLNYDLMRTLFVKQRPQ